MKRSGRFRLTLRGRLTLVYGGLFFLAGVVLLGTTYVLTARQLLAAPLTPDVVATAPPTQEPARSGETPAKGTEKPQQPPADDLPEMLRQARESALREQMSQGAIALGLVGLVALGAGWLVAGRMLRPLHRITDTARRIADAPAADRGLGERIALDGPRDELKDLADTFDVMLDQLDRSFDGQRRFIANASHELRTPLTINRTLIQVAQEMDDDCPHMRQLSDTLLAVNRRHERLIDGLLLLARSEREVLKRAYVDLADVAVHATVHLPPSKVAVQLATAEAPTSGNPVLLERLVQNLVENGVKYNVEEGGWVRVTTSRRPDGTAVLEVTNSGPIVPPYEVPDLFEPFHRSDNARLASESGAGLGLSIVRAVARAHGGDVRAVARDEGGLAVTVVFPPAS